MSGTKMDSPRQGLGYTQMTGRWGWFVALGVLLLLLGVLALGDVVAVTVVSAIFIGAALLVGGIFQIIHAFANKAWSAFLLNLVAGVLYVVGGLLIMQEPVQGSIIITLFLLLALVVGGILRIVIALSHRQIARMVDAATRRRDQRGGRRSAVPQPAVVGAVGAGHIGRCRIAGPGCHLGAIRPVVAPPASNGRGVASSAQPSPAETACSRWAESCGPRPAPAMALSRRFA